MRNVVSLPAAFALLFILLIALVAAVSLPAAAASLPPGYKAEYRISTVLGPPFPWGAAAEKWAALVNDHTDGRITLKVYPNAQLVHGDQTKEFTALRDGFIDASVSSTINWSQQIKELNLFSLPFFLPDYAAIDALTQGWVGNQLFDEIANKGIEPLAWGENGYRQLSNSKHPVLVPADLKGMTIRVASAPLFEDIFTELGAKPKPMSWVAAQQALAMGTVDGQENPLSVYVNAKLDTQGQTYVTLWNYAADPLIFAFNSKVWETFSPEDRNLVRDAAVQAGRLCVQLARDSDAKAIKAMPAQGVMLSRLDAAQQKAFVEATRGVFTRWEQRIGPDLVAEAQQEIADRQP